MSSSPTRLYSLHFSLTILWGLAPLGIHFWLRACPANNVGRFKAELKQKHTHTYIYIYIYIYTYTQIHTHTYMHICIHVYTMCIYIYIYI